MLNDNKFLDLYFGWLKDMNHLFTDDKTLYFDSIKSFLKLGLYIYVFTAQHFYSQSLYTYVLLLLLLLLLFIIIIYY